MLKIFKIMSNNMRQNLNACYILKWKEIYRSNTKASNFLIILSKYPNTIIPRIVSPIQYSNVQNIYLNYKIIFKKNPIMHPIFFFLTSHIIQTFFLRIIINFLFSSFLEFSSQFSFHFQFMKIEHFPPFSI